MWVNSRLQLLSLKLDYISKHALTSKQHTFMAAPHDVGASDSHPLSTSLDKITSMQQSLRSLILPKNRETERENSFFLLFSHFLPPNFPLFFFFPSPRCLHPFHLFLLAIFFLKPTVLPTILPVPFNLYSYDVIGYYNFVSAFPFCLFPRTLSAQCRCKNQW